MAIRHKPTTKLQKKALSLEKISNRINQTNVWRNVEKMNSFVLTIKKNKTTTKRK